MSLFAGNWTSAMNQRSPIIMGLVCVAVASRLATADEIAIASRKFPELTVKAAETVVIQPNEWYPFAFQFNDGRISVGWNHNTQSGMWSSDGGTTWSRGNAPPDQGSIELDNGEVLSLGFATKKRADGKYTLPQRRSLDGWKTVTAETGVLNIPRSVPCGGDGAETNDGFLMDHSVVRLKDGRLMATMYGNYEDDKTPADDYPKAYQLHKYRTVVVFSADKGKTWGDPVTVSAAPKVSQEGVCESDLARAANGDILCVMRSGGLPGKPTTPLYACRSSDEGKSWSEPIAILDRGVWPNLFVMQNGTIVCTTGRPDNWIVFSIDDGRTWGGEFCNHEGGSSCYTIPLEVTPDRLLVIYDRDANKGQGAVRHEIVGTFFSVKRE